MKALLFVEWITDTVKMMHALKRTMLSKGKKLAWITLFPDSLLTMLQKPSKCEVKAWLYWNLIILQPLRFYVKSNFGEFKQFKNVIFGNFKDSELWIFGKFGTWTLLKFTYINQNSEPLKLPKMTFMDHLNSPKLDFMQNWSGSKMIKFQQSQALTSEPLKLPNDIFGLFEFAKIWFHIKLEWQ